MFFYDENTNDLFIKIRNNENIQNQKISFISNDSSKSSSLSIRNSNDIKINNIKFEKSKNYGLEIRYSSNIIIRNSEFSNIGESGVYIIDAQDTVIESNIFKNIGKYGVIADSFSGVIENNEISNVHNYGPLNIHFSGTVMYGRGLSIECNYDTLLTKNKITNIGYVGISLRGKGCKVEKNYIKRVCFITDDCSAIYTWSSSYYDIGYHTISNNLIIDSTGNSYGTPTYFNGQRYDGVGHGIYGDDKTSFLTISNNVIINTKWCFQLHNSRNNTVVYFQEKNHCIYMKMDFQNMDGHN